MTSETPSTRHPTPIDPDSFRLMVESVQDYAIFMLDPHGYITTWNVGAERLKGYKASEIIGQHFSRFYPPDDISANKPANELRTAIQDGRLEDEGWRVRRDGSRFWANVIITTLRDPSGHVSGFAKVTRDLTERWRAEEALRDREERLRLLVESVGDYAIYMVDPNGHVTTWNAGAERLLGYAEGEILGQNHSRFYVTESVHADEPAKELRVAAHDGRCEVDGWCARKDGSRFRANVMVTPVNDKRGQLRGFAKIVRDLTALLRAEDERVRLAKADEAVRVRDEFLALASHELRTPLAALSMNLILLERALQKDGAPRPHMERAKRQVVRLTQQVDELLDVRRVQENVIELDMKRLSLGALVALQVDDSRAVDPTHSFIYEPHRDDLLVLADPARIDQVLSNLLQNAIKYSPAGSRITVRIWRDGNNASVSVSDQGIGIPAAEKSRLFERFFRASNARVHHVGGFGVGLYISRELARRHGGRLELESEDAKGSTFTLSLPLLTGQGVLVGDGGRADRPAPGSPDVRV